MYRTGTKWHCPGVEGCKSANGFKLMRFFELLWYHTMLALLLANCVPQIMLAMPNPMRSPKSMRRKFHRLVI